MGIQRLGLIPAFLAAGPLVGFADAAGPDGGLLDHLVPVTPSPLPELNLYEHRVERLLRAPDRGEAVVIRRPAFEGEECVAIRRARDDPARFVMVHTRANRNIYYATMMAARPVPVTITRRELPLPPGLGPRLHRLWERMLWDVGPAHEPGFVADRTTYEFRRGFRRGETSSMGELGVEPLTRLADALFDYGNAGWTQRRWKQDVIELRCRELEAEFARRPRSPRPPPMPIRQSVPARPAPGVPGLR